MFTGIIERTARVVSTKVIRRSLRVRIQKPHGWKLRIGESVSIDGICSTVVAQSATVFEVDYMSETRSKTTVETFVAKKRVNLERSLRYGQRVEGHFVQGHVDASAKIKLLVDEGSSRLITVVIPLSLKKYVVLHGSITVNGAALTVARLSGARCTVALIPHTLKHTNLGELKRGDGVNIEVDYLARHGIAALSRGGTVGRNAAKRIRKKAKQR